MLTVTYEYRQGILFVRLKGKLTKDTINKFNYRVINKIIDGGIRNVVFNVNDLKAIDINGIHRLLYSYEICQKNEGCTFLCGNNGKISKVLKKSHILHFVKEISSEVTALKIINMRVR